MAAVNTVDASGLQGGDRKTSVRLSEDRKEKGAIFSSRWWLEIEIVSLPRGADTPAIRPGVC